MTRFYEFYLGNKKVSLRNKHLEGCLRIFREKVKKQLETDSLGFDETNLDQAIKNRFKKITKLIKEQLQELEFEEVNNLVKVLGVIPLTYPLLASLVSALGIVVVTEGYNLIFGDESE